MPAVIPTSHRTREDAGGLLLKQSGSARPASTALGVPVLRAARACCVSALPAPPLRCLSQKGSVGNEDGELTHPARNAFSNTSLEKGNSIPNDLF